MKLKDYIKEVKNHILAYDYACVVAVADYIVSDDKEYIKENFQNNVPTEDTAKQVWNRWENPAGIEPYQLREKHNCGSLPVALSHWEDFDMVETHKSGVITRVSTTDGPRVLYGRTMLESMECIMLDFELFPEHNY